MKNKGFSLVELIVVIAIMAILVGVAVPVYTSYIDQANSAKDEQLLDEINRAFTIVCAEKGIDTSKLTANTAKITISNGTVVWDTMLPAECATDMKNILGTDLKFSEITAIYYNERTHVFGTTFVTAYGDGYLSMDAEDIANLKNSTFGKKMTVSEMLDKLSDVVDYAGALGNAVFADILASDDFKKSAAAALGLPSTLAGEELNRQLTAKLNGLADTIIESDPALTEEDRAAVLNQIQTNAAVLYVAQNATETDPAEYIELLSNDGAFGNIAGELSNDKGVALSQAAVAYGMYASHAKYTNNDTNFNKEPLDALQDLNNAEFKTYMASTQGKEDLLGFLSALNMIESSTGDPNAVNQLMLNGFGDDALKGALSGAIDD